MLRGLPLSKVLGLWSGHSYSSPSRSGHSGSPCSCVSSSSSGPTLFSCEPIWCMCAREWSARCPRCNAYVRYYKMIVTWCIDKYIQTPSPVEMSSKGWNHKLLYKVVNIIQEYVTKVKHLLHSLLQVIINQPVIIVLQRYTKHHLFYSSYA